MDMEENRERSPEEDRAPQVHRWLSAEVLRRVIWLKSADVPAVHAASITKGDGLENGGSKHI
jgi:chorismate-pyruvate lyase